MEFDDAFHELVLLGRDCIEDALEGARNMRISWGARLLPQSVSALYSLEGSFHEESGDFESAREKYVCALSGALPFKRALLHRMLGELEEYHGAGACAASRCYRDALVELEKDERRSAGFFLVSFLRSLKGQPLSVADRDMVHRALKRSWAIRGLARSLRDAQPLEAAELVVEAENAGQRVDGF